MKRYFEVASRWLSRLCLTPQHNGLIAAIILLSSNPQSAFSSPSILEDEMTNLKSVLKNSSFSAKMSGFERDVDLLVIKPHHFKNTFCQIPTTSLFHRSVNYLSCSRFLQVKMSNPLQVKLFKVSGVPWVAPKILFP